MGCFFPGETGAENKIILMQQKSKKEEKGIKSRSFPLALPLTTPSVGLGLTCISAAAQEQPLSLNTKPRRLRAAIPYKRQNVAKCGLNLLLSQAHTAPSSAKIMSICWSPSLQGNPCSPSLRAVKKREGAGGGWLSLSLLMGLCRARHSFSEGETWLCGHEPNSHFLSLLQRFCVGFVMRSHQQEQAHSMLEKARVTTSSKGAGV